MSQKIFVTGASGTIGSHIVKQLLADNIPFTAGLSKVPDSQLPYEHAVINYNDLASLEVGFHGAETVFLLFPIADDLMTYASNAIQAAKNAGVKHIVRSGAGGASLDSPYQMIKLHGEINKMVEESGINYSIVQPSGFMQNFITFLGYPIKAGTVYNSNPKGSVAFIDARDIASVSVAILKDPSSYLGQKIEVSGSESITIPEALSRISLAIDRPVNYVPISHQQAHDSMMQYGASDYVAKLIGSVEQASAEGAMSKVQEGVQSVLGRAPISFAKFVSDHVAVWK